MLLSSELLTTYDACERRSVWMRRFERLRVPPLAALYRALDAGLTGEKPEHAGHMVMSIAATEGLDVAGLPRVYDVAVHYAYLATILATYLRAKGPPWVRVKDVPLGRHTWQSACYEAGERIRRVALVDYWGEDRRDQELRGWRSQGELAALGRPLLLNALSIGHTQFGRRASPWTRGWAHPRNHHIRFRRISDGYSARSEGFTVSWVKTWRESADLSTEQWLDQMLHDKVFDEAVHTVMAAVPPRVEETRQNMLRIAREMESQRPLPPMRRTGCYGFSPCPFLTVCYGPLEPAPSRYGFRRKGADWEQEEHDFSQGPESGPESTPLGRGQKIGLVQVAVPK